MARVFDYIFSIFPQKVETVGTVKRVWFCCLVSFRDDVTNMISREWHYYGTLPTDFGFHPRTADPVFLHTYVQFPQAFDDLGGNMNKTLFDLGIEAGLRREGLKTGSV